MYSQLFQQIQLTSQMIKGTKANFCRFFDTQDKWMANVVMGN